MNVLDAAIIGGGPAGLTAALYLARAGRTVQVFEAGVFGGQVFLCHAIENYPGFPKQISGSDLSDNMKMQAENFGVTFKLGFIKQITKQDKAFELKTGTDSFFAKTVLVATGSKPKTLGIEGETEFFGSGVSYCSTCDGMFFKNKNVVIIGGGNSAFEAVSYLSRICNKVSVVYRGLNFRAEKVLVERAKTFKNVELFYEFNPVKIIGKDKVESVVFQSKDGIEKTINCDGVFIYVGYTPQSELVKDILDCDELGYVKVNKNFETSISGLFGAGDVISKDVRQIATAVGDGCISALKMDKFLNEN